ncbi:unnamed protein product [Rhizophagus irregularis]|uniref:Protein kinase domain-containing protein n=1 Tax=Rhizophagus irregularis TaxID=588596 RepID=A0A915ZGM3_9GLOM|nr:unnamed protein product [Rhizophagus irregularis]
MDSRDETEIPKKSIENMQTSSSFDDIIRFEEYGNVPSRSKPVTVALKTLGKFMKASSDSLREFKTHYNCDLFPIHNAGYTHSDFHSGNILQLSNKSDLNDDIIASSAPASYAAIQYVPNLDTDICSYIADLGLSAPKGMQGILGDSSAGEIKIKKEFEASDKIIPIFTTTLQKHQEVYRSQRIPNLINYDDEVQKNSSNATDSLENFSISDFD